MMDESSVSEGGGISWLNSVDGVNSWSSVVDSWGVVGNGNWGGVVDWGVMGNSDWSVGNSDWGSNTDLSWGSVDNSVESVDGISGVGDGTNGTIGFNKGVFSLDNISVTGFVLVLLVSGNGIRNGISEVVLWMRVEWLGSNSLDDLLDWSVVDLWGSDGVSYGLSISDWVGSNGVRNSDSGISQRGGQTDWQSNSRADDGEEGDDLHHFDFVFLFCF